MADKPDPADALLSATKTSQAAAKQQAAPAATTGDPADALLSQTKSGAPPAGQSPAGGSGWGQRAKGDVYQAGQGLLEFGAGVAGLPEYVHHGVNKLFGIPDENQITRMAGPEAILSGLSKLGLYNTTPEAQPKNLEETVSRSFGGIAPGLVMGSAAGMGPVENALVNTVPPMVSDLASDYLPSWAVAPLTALAMTRGFSARDAAAARTAATQAAKEAAEKAVAAKEASSTFEMQGPAFAQSQREQASEVKAQAKRDVKMSVREAERLHDSEIQAANHDWDSEASKLGQSVTMQDGASAMQEKARDWLAGDFKTKIKTAEDGMYHRPDGSPLIPEDALGKMSNFKSVLDHSHYGAGEAEPIAAMFRSRLPEAVKAKVDALATEQGAPGQAPELAFRDQRALRSAVGDAMGDPKIANDIGRGKLAEMYRALSDDMSGTVNAVAGPEGLKQFNAFNKEATRLYGIRNGPLSEIISSANKDIETITPDQVIKNVMAGSDMSGVKLSQLASEPKLKEGLNEIAAAHMRQGTPFQETSDAHKWFNGLSSEAKTALLGDETSGRLKDVIDRKAAADKDLADMKPAAKEQKAQVIEGARMGRTQEATARREEGIALKQEAERTAGEAKTKAQEAADKTQPITLPHVLKQLGWHSIGGIPAALAGAAFHRGGLMGDVNLHGLAGAAHLPSWMADLAYLPAWGLGAGAVQGVKQIARDPLRTSRNMLMGAMSSNALTPKPPGSMP